MEDTGTKGIIACLYDLNGKYKYVVRSGDSIYLQVSRTHRFYLREDAPYLFGNNTENIKETINSAKWAYIFFYLWEGASAAAKGAHINAWVDHDSHQAQGRVDYAGIRSSYKMGKEIIFRPDEGSYWEGYYYRMEVFNYSPGKGLYFKFIVVDRPKIRFAYFDKQDLKPRVENFNINDGFYIYGQYVKLYLQTHMLPLKDSLPDEYDIEYEPNTPHLELNVWLTDVDSKLLDDPIVKAPLGNYITQFTGANSNFEIPIQIDTKWKDNIHTKDEEIKWYSVEIEIINTKTGKKYPCERLATAYQVTNLATGELDTVEVQQGFYVKYQSTDAILREFEAMKKNQIMSIGDVSYSAKEYDPCGYSRIKIEEDDRKVYIFDEDAKLTPSGVMDQSTRTFDIIRGDEKKDVMITVENLRNKGVPCYGVMLPEGQTHSNRKNVFLMDKVLTPKKSGNDFDRVEDHTHQEQLKQSGTKITEANKRDTDVYADPEADTNEVGGIQNFQINQDYEYEGENQLKLKLGYWYNKKFLESSFSGMPQEVLNSLWLFNYFWFNAEQAQTYFVPVSTCRYPNQIAQVRVYPDIKWDIGLSFRSDSPEQYSYTNAPAGKVATHHWEKAIAAANNKRWKKGNVSLELTLAAKTSDTRVQLQAAYADKIQQILDLIMGIKETLDDFCHVTEARKGMAGKLAKFLKTDNPITFQLDYPVININGSWKYGVDTDTQKVLRQGKLGLGFKPLIRGTGKLDIITCAEYIPTGGKIVSIARWVISKIQGKLWFNLYVKGEINLEGNIYFNRDKKIDLSSSTTVTVGVELGVAISTEVKKVNFEAAKVKKAEKAKFGGELSARGETSITLNGSAGVDKTGTYIEISADFGGVVAVINAKLQADDFSVGVNARKYPIVEPVPDLFKKTFYIISEK